jgi:hypothetical protein
MRRHPGNYFVIFALLLTSPLHIVAGSYALTEWIGNLTAPHSGHVLLWFPILVCGSAILLLVVIGIFRQHPLAFYAAAALFIGGLWTLSLFDRPTLLDRLVATALALFLGLSAAYILWIVRPISSDS